MTPSPTSAARYTREQRIAVLQGQLAGRSRQYISQVHRLTPDAIREILTAHGFPRRESMQAALAALTAVPVDQAVAVATSADAGTAAAPDSPTSSTSRQALVDVDVSRVHPDPDNARDDVGDVTELAQSMASTGLLQPIVVRPRYRSSDYVIVAGHRRYAAAIHLGWTTVPVIVRADMRPDEVLAAMLVENGHRTDLDPIEEARALNRLLIQMGEGTTHRQVATRIGRTQVHVSGRLVLLDLPLEEQELLRAKQMNVSDAVRRARVASGKVRPANSTGHPHLGVEHDLASRARARCRRLDHKAGGRNSVGGVACGECWESVIRADERQHLHAETARRGACALCDTPISRDEISATAEPTAPTS